MSQPPPRRRHRRWYKNKSGGQTMIQNVVGLFTNPDKAWRSIKAGEMTLGPIYLVHVLVLAAIPAVSAYIGTTQVGWTIGTLEPVKLTQASALQMTALTWLAMMAGTVAICYTTYLLYQGIPIFMGIPEEEGFLFASSILAVGLVVLVGMMATAVIFWGLGVGPVYLR